MNRIGICIKEFDSIFTNGCAQQGYFVLKSLRKSGFNVDFVTIEKQLKYFEIINEPVINICDVDVLKNYSIIVFSSLIVDQIELLNQIKLQGIKIANLMVGNYYIINCEEFVFNVHNNVIQDMNNSFVDEIWLMPMYKHVVQYISNITNKPVKISPYVWDNEIINKYIISKEIKPYYQNLSNNNTIDIVIMEPNLSIHKNALPLLVILNNYFLNYTERLGNIHIFGKPKRNPNCLECIRHLEIVKCNKIILYERTLSLEVFSRLRESNIKYVVLSNNLRNSLNFIHLECFTLNIPIIHNCLPYSDNKLYYEDSDVTADYSKINNYINLVWEGKYKYDNKTLDTLKQFHPYNKLNVHNYKLLAESLIKTNKMSIYDYNIIFKKKNNKINLIDDFCIIIIVKKDTNVHTLYKNLDKLNRSTEKKCIVRIFCTDDIKNIEIYSNLDIKVNKINDNNIELNSLAKTYYKKICFINSNTVSYLNVDDIKKLADDNNGIIAVNNKMTGDKKDVKTTNHFINLVFKAFGRDYKCNHLIDTNFFIYNNSEAFVNYVNFYLSNIDKYTDFIPKNIELSVLLTLICPNIVFFDSTHRLIVNKTANNQYYPVGYLISSKKNIVMFVNYDNNHKDNNLKNQYIVSYSSANIYKINNKTFYDVTYKGNLFYLEY